MTIIRGRAPLRLGLAGGGTDVSPYCDEFGGRILNATIDKYAYAYVEQIPDGVEFTSPDRECSGRAEIYDVDALLDDFSLHVAVYQRVMKEFNGGERVPLRLSTQVDAPPGSGLGSSSTLVVAMVTAMCELLKVSLSQYDTARLAWEIERVDLGLAGGWQDQYAATFGGFNYMESRPGGRVIVNPLRVRREVSSELEASLLLYFGGVSRRSADVIAEQQQNVVTGDADALDGTHALRQEAEVMKDRLLMGDIAGFAQSMHIGWAAKKRLATQITSPAIEQAYMVAAAHGMVAGKVSGAGGGGFMMLVVDPERRLEVSRSLERECGGTVMTCHFTERGAETWRVPGLRAS
jgi:D-glycero-alpha-D-manno-heptose-7-phosphate kinase